MPSSSEWWRKVDLQQRHKVKRQTPGFWSQLCCRLACTAGNVCARIPTTPRLSFPNQTGGEERPGSVSKPTKIWWGDV